MSSRSLKGLKKRIGFRLTVLYSVIFILSSTLLFGLAYFFLASSLSRQDQEAIRLKIRELSALYQTEGIGSLQREVTVEKKFQKKAPYFIRLAGPGHRTLVLVLPYQWAEFDLEGLGQPVSAKDMTWISVPARNGETRLTVASTYLTTEYVLQVGKSSEERKRVLRHFREIFAAVMIPLVFLGFVSGFLVSFRALRPIRHLIHTIRSIGSGRMDARVPSPQTGDELDELVMVFNGMVERIETLINAMRDALDNVAHDLRTPMTRMRGIAEMALQSEQDPAACREALADSLEESERILKMLNTLMDISEAETGVIKLDLKTVNVSTMLEEAAELYRYLAEDKGISLDTSSPEDLRVVADPLRMRQVLANLLDNAVKYTPAGGRILLRAESKGKQVLFLVEDTGTGIPPEEIPRIWDRLYRGDQSRSEKGLGLGLSLVKAVVHAHGGHVDVFSEPGKGSSFSIVLPAGI